MNWILVMLIPVILQPANLQNGHPLKRAIGHTVVYENSYNSLEECIKAPDKEHHAHFLMAPNVKHMCVQGTMF